MIDSAICNNWIIDKIKSLGYSKFKMTVRQTD